ncbi:MAG: adenylate/guanylate cyclase domain-containing protein [Gammaproteobacteria bacterium]
MTALRQKQDIAILHCDIVEFSRLTEQDEDGTLRAVVDGFARARKLVADHHGELVNTAGDSLLAVFDNADDAIQTAIGLQQHFAIRNHEHPESQRMHTRIGIHNGDARLRGDQAFGNDVNIAARLQERSPPGGICLSQSCFEKLSGEYQGRCTSIGAIALRKIQTEVTAHFLETGYETTTEKESRLDHGRLAILVMPETSNAISHESNRAADALSIEIISGLSRFRQLRVLSAHTSLATTSEDRPPQTRARLLGVDYLVQVRAPSSDNTASLLVELVDIRNDQHCWSQDFKMAQGRSWVGHADLITQIVSELSRHIELAAIGLTATPHPLAQYQQLLNVRRLLYRMHEPADMTNARAILDQLVTVHADHAGTHCAIGLSHVVDILMGWADDIARSIALASEHAALAIELDPLDSECHAVFGITAIWRRHHSQALNHLNQAIALNPSHADARAGRGLAMIFLGEPAAAFEQIQEALRYNPVAPAWYHWALAISCYNSGQYRNALDAIGKITRLNRFHRRLLAASHAQLGDIEAAHEEQERVMREVPGYRIDDTRRSHPYQDVRDLQPFLEGLRRAGFE